jgi:predicted ester cyclase
VTVAGVTVPPTGRRVEWRGVFMRRIAGGKLVEGWGTNDNAALLRQLGVTMTPPGPNAD